VEEGGDYKERILRSWKMEGVKRMRESIIIMVFCLWDDVLSEM
jgi:hypothetical protein